MIKIVVNLVHFLKERRNWKIPNLMKNKKIKLILKLFKVVGINILNHFSAKINRFIDKMKYVLSCLHFLLLIQIQKSDI